VDLLVLGLVLRLDDVLQSEVGGCTVVGVGAACADTAAGVGWALGAA
jgi:hypothetical protein